MPVIALFSGFRLRLSSCFANTRTELTTVSMIVQNMVSRSNFSTWRLFESKIIHYARNFIWELSWLKPHNVIHISIFNLFKNSLVQWGQLMLVHISWKDLEEHADNSFPRRHWFIKWIKSNNELVRRKFLGYMSPEVNILVLNTKIIIVESSE